MKSNQEYMAVDQHGHIYPNLKHPRKDLCERLDKSHAAKIYQNKNDGSTKHVGYIIGGLWLTLYVVTPFEKSA